MNLFPTLIIRLRWINSLNKKMRPYKFKIQTKFQGFFGIFFEKEDFVA